MERTQFRAWGPMVALVSVPALAVVLAVSLVPSRIKAPARRISSTFNGVFSDSAAPDEPPSDTSNSEAAAAPSLDAAAEVPVLDSDTPGLLPLEAAAPTAETAAAETAQTAPADAAEAGQSADKPPSAVGAVAARPLVTVWPSARRRRQEARQAAAAEAARTSESSGTASADAASAAAAGIPNVVYVPLFLPTTFIAAVDGAEGMDGMEGAGVPEDLPGPEPGPGFAVGVAFEGNDE